MLLSRAAEVEVSAQHQAEADAARSAAFRLREEQSRRVKVADWMSQRRREKQIEQTNKYRTNGPTQVSLEGPCD